jgi:hypothetical protein
LEESTLSSKVLGNGRKYAFFGSFLGLGVLEESTLSSRVLNMETRRVYVLFYTVLQECQGVAMNGQYGRLDSESTYHGIPDSSFGKVHNATLLLCLASK